MGMNAPTRDKQILLLRSMFHLRPPFAVGAFSLPGLLRSAGVFSPLAHQMAQQRGFGSTKVYQKRRYNMRILKPMQTKYVPKPPGYQPLPLSLMASGAVRRLVKANTQESYEMAQKIDWDRYKCDVRGVRWHPNGSWRVQFHRSNHQHNFFVKVSCYFRVALYGFEGAKQLAIGYRRRLEVEWDELTETWEGIDKENAARRVAARERKRLEAEGLSAMEGEQGYAFSNVDETAGQLGDSISFDGGETQQEGGVGVVGGAESVRDRQMHGA
eukprot:GDKI01040642.1.p1 GENE.GDKI01040642.1~~GDKI01040642.1.p1  ORF type:complete len:270 (-),score=41.58 GDKI01040642.1:180-989(-)